MKRKDDRRSVAGSDSRIAVLDFESHTKTKPQTETTDDSFEDSNERWLGNHACADQWLIGKS